MGFKKEIWMTFILVAVLGVFFQLNRMDTLLYIDPRNNNEDITGAGENGPDLAIEALPREKYLVIYDPAEVQSVLKRHMVEKILHEQKKDVSRISLYQSEKFDASCQGVIIATGRLKDVRCLPAIEQYVEQGGSVMLISQLQAEMIPEGMMEKLGIASVGNEASVYGIRVLGNMYLCLQGFGFDSASYSSAAARTMLLPESDVEVTSEDGTPIIWSHASGRGRYWIYNSRERSDKNSYGTYAAMLGQLQEDCVYPVMNMKIFFIDAFLSSIPEGEFDRIYRETGLNAAEFYRKLWWPEMLNNAEKYDWKYTGMIIGSYNNQVKGPFLPLEARNALIVYGRELLKSGGELGVYGYNQQSLAMAGYGQEHFGYSAWESQQDMEESLKELKRYIEDVYPGYEIRSYVPPSNIFSAEGKSALANVFPHMRVYASRYNVVSGAKEYCQDFRVNPDGTCELPRTSSGYAPAPEDIWESYNVINYNGIFSHYVSSTEIFYSESKDVPWSVRRNGLRELFADMDRRFDWLEPVTASEAADIMENYFAMDYRVERSAAGMKLHCWHFSRPVSFILRTGREIRSVQGGRARRIQQNAYLLTAEEPELSLEWAGGKL